jgi:hypothetical protein
MKGLADYVHSKGLKLGTYNDMGTSTCGKYPGECKDTHCTLPGYMTVDAQTYADWGIDSLKMDGCNSVHTHAILDPAYIFMGDSMNKTGRPILYSCSWPDYIRSIPATVDYANTAAHCNIWRMYGDIQVLLHLYYCTWRISEHMATSGELACPECIVVDRAISVS